MPKNLKLTLGQAKFLMYKFNIKNPNKAIDLMIEMMVLEGVDPMEMKQYILKMMQKELRDVSSK